MYITSGHNPDALRPNSHNLAWPGPRLLLVEQNDPLDQKDLKFAEQHYFVFEFVQAPMSRIDMLRAALLRAMRGPINLRGPLLFTENALSEDDVNRLSGDVENNKWIIERATDPADGRLTLLVLGLGIVENPLFPTFLENLNPGLSEADTEACLKAIQEHLVWKGR